MNVKTHFRSVIERSANAEAIKACRNRKKLRELARVTKAACLSCDLHKLDGEINATRRTLAIEAEEKALTRRRRCV